MSDEFNFLGLPSNDALDIPDPAPKKKKKGSNPLGDMFKDYSEVTPEQLRSMLPPETLQNIEETLKSMGSSITSDDVLAKTLEVMGRMADGEDLQDILDEIEDPEEAIFSDESFHYDLDVEHLATYFGQLVAKRCSNIVGDIQAAMGTDTSTYLGEHGCVGSYLTDITSKLSSYPLKGLKFILSNEFFAMYFAQPADPTLYGYFVCIFKNSEGKFESFIPEFQNTFSYDKVTKEVRLFNIDPKNQKNDLRYFHKNKKGELEFNLYNEGGEEFAAKCWICPENKRTILTPHQFGRIKNTMPVINSDSNILKIGTIVSNESEGARTLKVDADLPKDQLEFPFYINFGYTADKDTLRELASIFFTIDWNACALLDNTELMFDNGSLYIDVDLGEF